MNPNKENKTVEKIEFETAEIEVIQLESADIICTSPIIGEEDYF